jgi:hypothetical protein
MKINEILSENELAAQLAKDSELMANAMRQRWEAEQRAKQPVPAPTAAPAIQVTPDMIAKHPQYKTWYDKYYQQEINNGSQPYQATAQAKKFADGKITRFIQQGQ